MSAFEALLNRRSYSSVGDDAPKRKELLRLVDAASTLADHKSLRPWRLIELRGDARDRIGEGLAKAEGKKGHDVEKYVRKAHRSPLVIAVVSSPRKGKLPEWEQEAVASGVAHNLSLLLDEAGWGVFWRTGSHTRHKAVAKSHELEPGEKLLGWLHVGAKPVRRRHGRRKPIDPKKFLTRL